MRYLHTTFRSLDSLQQKAKGECILMDETVAGKAGDTSKLLFPVLKRGHQE